MEYLTKESLPSLFFGAAVIFLVVYGCVHFKAASVGGLSTKLAAGISFIDSEVKDQDLTKAAVVSLGKANAFMNEIDDGEFDATAAIKVLENLNIEGKTLSERLGPLKMKALMLLISDMYIDLKPVGDYLPEELNKEFARKFKEFLRATLLKLKG